MEPKPGSTGLSVRRTLLDSMKILLSWNAMVTTQKKPKSCSRNSSLCRRCTSNIAANWNES